MRTIFIFILFFVSGKDVLEASSSRAAIDSLFSRLGSSEREGYPLQEFREDLKKISELKLDEGVKGPLEPREQVVVFLAQEIQKEENNNKVKELIGWYGHKSYEMPEEYFQEKFSPLRELGARITGKKVSFAEMRKKMKNDVTRMRGRVDAVVELEEEHAHPSYLVAWNFLLLMPSSEKKQLFEKRLHQALSRIGDRKSLVLLVEDLKINVKGRSPSRERIIRNINTICEKPSDHALEALLECHLFFVKEGVGKGEGFSSPSRHIVRRLASRRVYADQLIDPKMKAVIERNGYKEKPEEIPLTDDLWKRYKPLIEARLHDKGKDLNVTGVELMESALKIMPVK